MKHPYLDCDIDRDEADFIGMLNCAECNTRLNKSNRHQIGEDFDCWYCQKCADKILTDKWESGFASKKDGAQ